MLCACPGNAEKEKEIKNNERMEQYNLNELPFLVTFLLCLNLLMVSNSDPLLLVTDVESLHINCGGKQVVVGDITYDEDMDSAGPTVFKQSRNNWTFSNTGHFVVNDTLAKQGKLPAYATENETRLYMTDAELYKNARISPMSLTYYGFCLENGDYTVKLHFAEIMFTADSTYSCLGRRLLDVIFKYTILSNKSLVSFRMTSINVYTLDPFHKKLKRNS